MNILNKIFKKNPATDDFKKIKLNPYEENRLLDEILNDFTLDKLLAKADKQEKQDLIEVLFDDKIADNNKIISGFESLVKNKEYRNVLFDCASMMKIAIDGDETIVEIETRILETAYERFRGDFNRASFEDQNKLLASINKKCGKRGNLTKETLAASEISTIVSLDFGQYLAVTTTLGALSVIIGIRLPFHSYIFINSFNKIIVGPVGWTNLSLPVIKAIIRHWRDKSKVKIISCVIILSLIRHRLKHKSIYKK